MPKKALSTGWWVYILETQRGTLYTGVTTHLLRRWRQHRGEISGGAKFTRAQVPLQVVWTLWVRGRSAALKKEAELKRLSRTQKLRLIAGAPE